jgi:hypothetical protein
MERTLVPVDPGTGVAVMMASDTAGNMYYPMICVYQNLFPKLFLAKDPVAGAAILADSANILTLTGGQVTTCGFLAFTSDQKGDNDP